MKTAHRFAASVVVAAILAALFVTSARSVKADNAQTLAGTWITWILAGPGLRIPALQVYSADGTVVSEDAIKQGGVPDNPLRGSPMYGVWTRTGPASFAIKGLFLVFDATSSVLIGFGRTQGTVVLSTPEANEASGTISVEFLACPSPLTCPDPQAADAAWAPFPGFGSSMLVTATRLRSGE